MKNIMLNAYTTFNLGDDLFIKIICERYPETRFILNAPKKYKILFKDLENLKIISNDLILVKGINFFFRKLGIDFFVRRVLGRFCDAGVYIGGSLFMQGETWEAGLKNVQKMKIQDKPFYLLGVNFGPFHDEIFYSKYREIFKDYTDICFREKHSYQLFSDLDNSRLAADIVFQLNNKKISQIEDSIVISVIKPSKKKLANYDGIYYKKIRDIAIYFIDKGYKVTLMSFCKKEGDEEAINIIMDTLPNSYLNKISKHFYRFNIKETLKIIASSKFVVATRFHSMILGWIYEKPVFPIAYSEKMTNVMNDVGFTGLYTDFNNLENLKVEEVFNCMATNKIDITKQVIDAEKHFEKLDQYLLGVEVSI